MYMKSGLIMLVKAQLTLCRQLTELGERQREYILHNLCREMAETVKEQESAFRTFLQIEEKKRLLAKEGGAPAAEEDALRLLEEKLRQGMLRLCQINRANEKLVTNEMKFIDFNINIMTQTTADDIYAPQGQGGSVISKKKMFDQTI